MSSKNEHIMTMLRIAREQQNLSQRELSQKVGVPQGHISNIESGKVDIKTSTLIDFARSLNLELMLIPRPLVKTIQYLVDHLDAADEEVIPAYRLDED